MRSPPLVTGGSGLLGSALKELNPQAIFLNSQDGDLKDPCQVENIFKKYRPQKVLHLAARVGGVKSNALYSADYYSDNVLMNTNVLNTAQKHGVKKLISVLSSCAFPTFEDRPTTEKDLFELKPFSGNLGYGYAKRMLALHTKLLREQYGCDYSTITPVTLFGPNDNFSLEEGHVVGALIHKCYLAKKENKPFEVWGSGESIRQFVYSFDVAKILLKLLNDTNSLKGDTLIVNMDSGITIKELAQMITKVIQFEGPLVFNKNFPEGNKKRVLESLYFGNYFSDFKFTNMEQALSQTVKWFIKQVDGNDHL